MISLEQDFQQSLSRALKFGAFLDSLGDAGCARRSGALRAEPVALSQAKPPAAIANGSNDNGRR